MIYDLHVHSNKSDGKYDRYDLIKKMIDSNFEYASFTDHNYISNLNIYNSFIERQTKNKLKLINGIEFDVSNFKDMHILGYDIKNIDFIASVLENIDKENIEICKRLIINLREKYKFDINLSDLLNENRQISKGSIRDILVEKGYAENHLIAGNLYTGKNSYKYEKTKSLSYEEIINLIKESGGLSFLAHPSTLNLSDEELFKLVKNLKIIGLDGIEVLNTSKTTNKQFNFYRDISSKFDLLESCGSDFHNNIYTQKLGIENEISKKLIYKIEGR
ncbi:MAG: PHP domain-containing protein [Bacilli bacterium]|nr:PHP domain-containing protein [Bacilli bacterium]